jgi:hypothetical protein
MGVHPLEQIEMNLLGVAKCESENDAFSAPEYRVPIIRILFKPMVLTPFSARKNSARRGV